MHRGRRLVAPGIGAHLNGIEPAMFGIGEREIASEQLGSRAEIDDAAVGVEAAADAGAPTIAEIDPAGERRFGGGDGGSRVDLMSAPVCCAENAAGSAEQNQQRLHFSRFRSTWLP